MISYSCLKKVEYDSYKIVKDLVMELKNSNPNGVWSKCINNPHPKIPPPKKFIEIELNKGL